MAAEEVAVNSSNLRMAEILQVRCFPPNSAQILSKGIKNMYYLKKKKSGIQPGLGELGHDGLLLRQERVYEVSKGKKKKVFPARMMI